LEEQVVVFLAVIRGLSRSHLHTPLITSLCIELWEAEGIPTGECRLRNEEARNSKTEEEAKKKRKRNKRRRFGSPTAVCEESCAQKGIIRYYSTVSYLLFQPILM
jgi:hypothetical protein